MQAKTELGGVSFASPQPPKNARMLKTTYTLSDFIGWQRDRALTLKPPFQRNSVWSPGAKSYFIDTLIKDMPTPLILLRERRADLKQFVPHRDVVDGQQRLRTAISYVAPHLLPDLDEKDRFVIKEEHNEALKGRSFAELPNEIKAQILNYQFSVNVFPSDTDDRIIIQLFSRLNSTGYRLNNQELRNAKYYGYFKNVVEILSFEQLNRWREWHTFTSDNLARMLDIELSSEFAIFMLNGITEKSDDVITDMYEKYDESFPQRKIITKRFRHVFQAINDRLGADVAKLFPKRTKFYALFVAVYHLIYGIKSDLRASKTASPFTAAAAKAIKDAGTRIANDKAPAVVLASIKRTPSHRRERTRLVNYLLKGV